MVKVKLQKHKGLRGKYMTYLVTLPKQIIESTNFGKAKKIDIEIKDRNKLILKVVKK